MFSFMALVITCNYLVCLFQYFLSSPVGMKSLWLISSSYTSSYNRSLINFIVTEWFLIISTFWLIMTNVAMNIPRFFLWWTYVCSSLRYVVRSCTISVFNILSQTVFQSGYTVLECYQQYRRVSLVTVFFWKFNLILFF